MLLQEGEFSKKEKQAKTKLDTLSGVYSVSYTHLKCTCGEICESGIYSA